MTRQFQKILHFADSSDHIHCAGIAALLFIKQYKKTGDVTHLGSIPGQGRVRDRLFFCPSESTCADLFVPEPPSCVWHIPKCVRTLNIPYPPVVKEQVLHHNKDQDHNEEFCIPNCSR